MLKRSRGRWLKTVGFTCLVTEKPEKGVSLGKRRQVPPSIAWREGRLRHQLRTDVLLLDPHLVLQASPTLGPGDSVRFNDSVASIGAAITHPVHGPCVTTAGHLFDGAGAIGSLATIVTNGSSVPVLVKQCVQAQAIDYALLAPTQDGTCDNLYEDFLRLGPVFIPTSADIGQELMVLDGFGKSVTTICRGVDVEMDLPSGHYKHVIVTDALTEPGQSGGCLIDNNRRIWGFVLGVVGDAFSLFLPAHLLLALEGAQLTRG